MDEAPPKMDGWPPRTDLASPKADGQPPKMDLTPPKAVKPLPENALCNPSVFWRFGQILAQFVEKTVFSRAGRQETQKQGGQSPARRERGYNCMLGSKTRYTWPAPISAKLGLDIAF
jgi:hypothetical protein